MRRAVPLLLLTVALTAGCADTDGGNPVGGNPGGAATSTDPSAGASADGSPAGSPAGSASASTRATAPGSGAAPGGSGVERTAQGTFGPYTEGTRAITYDPAVVPAGATAKLAITPAGDGVAVRVRFGGMLPRRAYGAHLHTNMCGPSAAQAGPHYQHSPDPAAVASPPSVDPRYANPGNEVWVDFTTDASGAASVSAATTWPFDGINPPRSLVVHAERTATAPGRAGTAGARVACLTLPD